MLKYVFVCECQQFAGPLPCRVDYLKRGILTFGCSRLPRRGHDAVICFTSASAFPRRDFGERNPKMMPLAKPAPIRQGYVRTTLVMRVRGLCEPLRARMSSVFAVNARGSACHVRPPRLQLKADNKR